MQKFEHKEHSVSNDFKFLIIGMLYIYIYLQGLLDAANRGNLEEVRLALVQGADINCRGQVNCFFMLFLKALMGFLIM